MYVSKKRAHTLAASDASLCRRSPHSLAAPRKAASKPSRQFAGGTRKQIPLAIRRRATPLHHGEERHCRHVVAITAFPRRRLRTLRLGTASSVLSLSNDSRASPQRAAPRVTASATLLHRSSAGAGAAGTPAATAQCEPPQQTPGSALPINGDDDDSARTCSATGWRRPRTTDSISDANNCTWTSEADASLVSVSSLPSPNCCCLPVGVGAGIFSVLCT
jgi:hypothetical protein